jgi:hypothetical protein
LSSSFVARIATRYAPFDFSYVKGFPNAMPNTKYWEDCLPSFKEDNEDSLAQHLVDFHECMYQLDNYHEDVLMKVFMISLDGDARQWYKSLPTDSISSLKYFHVVFHSHCKIFYPVEILYEYCCNGELKEQVPQDNHDDKGFSDE